MTNVNIEQGDRCDEIARLALAMYEKSYFFSLRRGLSISFYRDTDGSGTQLLEITRRSGQEPHLIEVIFDVTYSDDDFLYEADLIKDQRKDYEPTINFGKQRFFARRARLKIDWGSEEVQRWRHDVERLSRSPDTLAGWVEADLEMLVRCSEAFGCGRKTVLTSSDLALQVEATVTLEDLKARLTCLKCGKRQADVLVF